MGRAWICLVSMAATDPERLTFFCVADYDDVLQLGSLILQDDGELTAPVEGYFLGLHTDKADAKDGVASDAAEGEFALSVGHAPFALTVLDKDRGADDGLLLAVDDTPAYRQPLSR